MGRVAPQAPITQEATAMVAAPELIEAGETSDVGVAAIDDEPRGARGKCTVAFGAAGLMLLCAVGSALGVPFVNAPAGPEAFQGSRGAV